MSCTPCWRRVSELAGITTPPVSPANIVVWACGGVSRQISLRIKLQTAIFRTEHRRAAIDGPFGKSANPLLSVAAQGETISDYLHWLVQLPTVKLLETLRTENLA